MKRKVSLIAGAVASILGAACSVSVANSYVFDGFEGNNVGDVPAGWGAATGVIVTNVAPKAGTKDLFVPVLSGLTNSTALPVNNGQVWTDFYTKPVKLSAVAPAVDSNATAQVFVNSNGMWCTISGTGNGTTFYTNTWTGVLAPGAVYPTVTVASAWHHLSVLHDYTTGQKNWSLYVDDIPIATNLGFIAAGTASITNFNWFQVQNLGGDSSNVVWVDDFMVTNRVPQVLADATNQVNVAGLSPAELEFHFGTFSDPRPVNTNIDATGTGVVLAFQGIQPGVNYVVEGTTSPLGAGWSSNGVIQGSISTVYSNSALLSDKTRFFMRVSPMSRDDGSTPLGASTQVYAAYKQFRSPSSTFIVGVPVEYANAADRTIGGKLGEQLKSGLVDGDSLTIVTNSTGYTYNLVGGAWENTSGDALLNKEWAPGVGMVVTRGAGGGSTTTVFAGLKETNSVHVGIPSGSWTYLTWPHNDASFNNGAALGVAASSGDYIYIQTNGAANYIPARYNAGTWRTRLNGTGPALSLTLQAGDGIIYRTAGASKEFSTVGP